jgi:hypothetical protein
LCQLGVANPSPHSHWIQINQIQIFGFSFFEFGNFLFGYGRILIQIHPLALINLEPLLKDHQSRPSHLDLGLILLPLQTGGLIDILSSGKLPLLISQLVPLLLLPPILLSIGLLLFPHPFLLCRVGLGLFLAAFLLGGLLLLADLALGLFAGLELSAWEFESGEFGGVGEHVGVGVVGGFPLLGEAVHAL